MVIYSSAFNIIRGKFEYLSSVDNFCKFADKVVIACNTSTDGTLSELHRATKDYHNLYIIESDISYDDPLLDGKVKNVALHAAESLFTDDTLIGLDLDEKIPLSQKDTWRNLSNYLFPEYDSIFIPSINLWGDYESVRWDEEKNRAYKWYMHGRGFNRAPYWKGLKEDGKLNIEVSDGTELVAIDGNLTKSIKIDQHLDKITTHKRYFESLDSNNLPYVIHEGYLSFSSRISRNFAFWSEQWSKCSGTDVKIPMNEGELSKYPTVKHGLKL